MGPQEMAISSDYDTSGFRITIDDQMTLVGVKDEIYMSMSSEKYLAMPVEGGNYEATLMMATGGGGIPDPVVPLRLGKDPVKPEEIPAMLSLAAMKNPKLTAYREEGGMKQVLLEGQGGSGIISIDGVSGLIKQVNLSVSPENAPAQMSIGIVFSIDAATPAKLPKPIAFDTEGRTKVATQEELFPEPPKALEVGAMAPDFSAGAPSAGNRWTIRPHRKNVLSPLIRGKCKTNQSP